MTSVSPLPDPGAPPAAPPLDGDEGDDAAADPGLSPTEQREVKREGSDKVDKLPALPKVNQRKLVARGSFGNKPVLPSITKDMGKDEIKSKLSGAHCFVVELAKEENQNWGVSIETRLCGDSEDKMEELHIITAVKPNSPAAICNKIARVGPQFALL